MTDNNTPGPPSSSRGRGKNFWTAVIAVIVVVVVVGSVVGYYVTRAPSTPTEIKVGILYSSTGGYASSSMPEYDGFLLWEKLVNANGGVFVPQYNKKLPIKVYSLDDGSSASVAETDYGTLITQDHVNVLVADFGSVLTSPAVTVAENNHVLLIDVTGSSANFFNASSPNPYVVLTSIPFTPSYVENAPLNIIGNYTKVAVLYATNDFTEPLANDFVAALENHGITPVYNTGYDTSTTDFSTYISAIAATKPQAVIEYGYPTDDIPFLNQLNSSGNHFNYTFTVFPGQLFADMEAGVGNNMSYTYTFSFPPEFAYKNVNYGLNQSAFETQWNSTITSTGVNFLSLAGYNAGLILQKAIENAKSLSSADLRSSMNTFSGNLTTLMGPFDINTTTGAQLGQTPPIGEIVPGPGGTLHVVIIYPPSLATGKPVYPP